MVVPLDILDFFDQLIAPPDLKFVSYEEHKCNK